MELKDFFEKLGISESNRYMIVAKERFTRGCPEDESETVTLKTSVEFVETEEEAGEVVVHYWESQDYSYCVNCKVIVLW